MRSRPSYARPSDGNEAPASAAIVIGMSYVVARAHDVIPAAILPGQWTSAGSRIPPSQVLAYI